MKKFYQTEEFRQLKIEWYSKLEASNFDDIEWHDPTTGLGQGSPFLKRDNTPLRSKLLYLGSQNYSDYILRTYLHYSAARNFLSHALALPFLDRYLLNMYVEGLTYRQIEAQLNKILCRYPQTYNNSKELTCNYSLTWIFHRLKKLKQDVAVWNHTNEEGIDYDI